MSAGCASSGPAESVATSAGAIIDEHEDGATAGITEKSARTWHASGQTRGKKREKKTKNSGARAVEMVMYTRSGSSTRRARPACGTVGSVDTRRRRTHQSAHGVTEHREERPAWGRRAGMGLCRVQQTRSEQGGQSGDHVQTNVAVSDHGVPGIAQLPPRLNPHCPRL